MLKRKHLGNRVLFFVLFAACLVGFSSSVWAACIICKPVYGGAEFEYNGSTCPSYTAFVRNCPAPPPPAVPGAPSLSYSMSSITSFELFWTGGVGATYFEYQYRIDGGGWSNRINTTSNPLPLTVTSVGEYDYRVYACSAGGCGSQSNSVSVTIIEPVLNGSGAIVQYSYDALGRLTFVEDEVNGNRDYDYDRAGNREEVTVGEATDIPPFNPPPSPTGLSCSQIAPSVYQANWGAVSGANYYVAKSNTAVDPYVETTGTSTVFDGSNCVWVKACNSLNQCSDKSYF